MAKDDMAKDEEKVAGTASAFVPVRPLYQEYLVLVQIGGAGDAEVFQPGARIALDDDRARLHLAAGNIRPLDHTELPPEPPPTQIVHDAPQPSARRKG
jgi:hypothetical protein